MVKLSFFHWFSFHLTLFALYFSLAFILFYPMFSKRCRVIVIKSVACYFFCGDESSVVQLLWVAVSSQTGYEYDKLAFLKLFCSDTFFFLFFLQYSHFTLKDVRNIAYILFFFVVEIQYILIINHSVTPWWPLHRTTD